MREQLVVSASRRDELLSEVAAPTTVIDRQEIEDSATQTLEQLLIEQAGSGVYVSRSFGIGFPSINGVGGNRVLVLVDGQRRMGADNGTRDGIDLDQYPTERIDRIEVVKGASSALYGSDAMGGVINLVSRQPDKPFIFDFNNSYGSFGERNLGSTMGFKHGRWGGLASGVICRRAIFCQYKYKRIAVSIDFHLGKLLRCHPSYDCQADNPVQVTCCSSGAGAGVGLDLDAAFVSLLGAGCLRDGVLYR